MIVRVTYSINVPTWLRRALRCRVGETGLATRTEIVAWYTANGHSCDADLAQEHAECCKTWGS